MKLTKLLLMTAVALPYYLNGSAQELTPKTDDKTRADQIADDVLTLQEVGKMIKKHSKENGK